MILTTGFYLALGLRIRMYVCRAVCLLSDVAGHNPASLTEQCANSGSRMAGESFGEFCGLFFDTFSAQLCLRI